MVFSYMLALLQVTEALHASPRAFVAGGLYFVVSVWLNVLAVGVAVANRRLGSTSNRLLLELVRIPHLGTFLISSSYLFWTLSWLNAGATTSWSLIDLLLIAAVCGVYVLLLLHLTSLSGCMISIISGQKPASSSFVFLVLNLFFGTPVVAAIIALSVKAKSEAVSSFVNPLNAALAVIALTSLFFLLALVPIVLSRHAGRVQLWAVVGVVLLLVITAAIEREVRGNWYSYVMSSVASVSVVIALVGIWRQWRFDAELHPPLQDSGAART